MSVETMERVQDEQVVNTGDFDKLEERRHEEMDTQEEKIESRHEPLEYTPRKKSFFERLRDFVSKDEKNHGKANPAHGHDPDESIRRRLEEIKNSSVQSRKDEGGGPLNKRINEGRDREVVEEPVGVVEERDKAEDEVISVDVTNQRERIKTAGRMASEGDTEGIEKLYGEVAASGEEDRVISEKVNEDDKKREEGVNLKVEEGHSGGGEGVSGERDERMQRDKRLFDSMRHQVMQERNKGDKNYDGVFSETWRRIIEHFDSQNNETEVNRMKVLAKKYPEGFPKGYGESDAFEKVKTDGETEEERSDGRGEASGFENSPRTNNPVLDKYLEGVRRMQYQSSGKGESGENLMKEVVDENKKIDVPELKPIEKKSERRFFGIKRK